MKYLVIKELNNVVEENESEDFEDSDETIPTPYEQITIESRL